VSRFVDSDKWLDVSGQWKVGGEDEHHCFGGKCVEGHGWRDTECWQRSCDWAREIVWPLCIGDKALALLTVISDDSSLGDC